MCIRDRYYACHPPDCSLLDRVVVINTLTPPYYAPFGAIGTIIGIVGSRFEVLFDDPFIGGTNLNGRTPWFRGAIMDFSDLFNLTRWMKDRGNKTHIIARSLNPPGMPEAVYYGWDGFVDLGKVWFPKPERYSGEDEEEQKSNGRNEPPPKKAPKIISGSNGKKDFQPNGQNKR
eukprot:TRINITY_DN1202_c0_g3_i6.p1 TRINITY_DN1202_c0_g3~~TRINITY_DN1202_c0_g3_i6.p1  ORF type:complete len:174 (-),score=22.41 TRINITY_DN1202_c0_g3_i6:256-777(-)